MVSRRAAAVEWALAIGFWLAAALLYRWAWRRQPPSRAVGTADLGPYVPTTEPLPRRRPGSGSVGVTIHGPVEGLTVHGLPGGPGGPPPPEAMAMLLSRREREAQLRRRVR